MKEIIHALGCANGAAMRSLNASQLLGLNEDQLAAVIVSAMPGAPLASSQQLESWAYGVLSNAGLGGLDELGKLKKKLKKLKKTVSKVAKAVVKNPMAIVGVATGNPVLIKASLRQVAQNKIKGAIQRKKAQALARVQQAAQEVVPVVQDVQQIVQQGQQIASEAGNWLPTKELLPPEPTLGRVERLPMADDDPRIVGLSLDGIVDSIKANPVPWLVAGGVAVWVWGNRHAA